MSTRGKLMLCAWLVGISGQATAMDPFVHQLNVRLEQTGADAVNSYLDDNFEKMVPRLRESVRRCDPDALALTIKLLDTTNASAEQGNSAMLELAMGRCPERLLPMIPASRARALCDVVAFMDNQPGAVGPRKMLKEIDRRIRYLQDRDALAKSEKGQACLEGYEEFRQQLADAVREQR